MRRSKYSLLEKYLILDQLIGRIRDDDKLCIVVEGFSDFEKLRKIGVKGKIFILNKFRIEEIIRYTLENNYKMLILTDYDHEGVMLEKKIRKIALSYGVRLIDGFRNELRKLSCELGYEISDILDNYIRLSMLFNYKVDTSI